MSYDGIGFINGNPPAINAENLNKMDNELVLLDKTATNSYNSHNNLEAETQMLESDGYADWNNVEYEMGTIALNGDMSDSTASIRTKDFIRIYSDCRIYPKNGYRFRIIKYNKDGSYVNGVNWYTTGYTISSDYIYKLVINKEGVSPASPSDKKNIVIYSIYTNHFPYVKVTNASDLDLNSLKKGALSFSGTAAPNNYPTFLGTTYGRTHIIFTFRQNNISLGNGDNQLLIQSNSIVCRRDYQSGSWGNWVEAKSNEFINNNTVISSASGIDVNSLKNGLYGFIASVVPDNLPIRSYGGENIIITLRVNNSTLSNFDKQILICNGEIYAHRQYYRGNWLSWNISSSNKNFIVDINGTGNYTSLSECIKYINDNSMENVVVKVKKGIYDLISEFKALYGNDYFDNLTDNFRAGIKLDRNITIDCEEGVLIDFEYTGNNANVLKGFSPFNLEPNHNKPLFTIKGAEIKVKNGRYCVHDEASSTQNYTHTVYKNCKMYIDNSENSEWNTPYCIGGGLGRNSFVEIENCQFEYVPISGVNTDATVSYHNAANSAATDAKSLVIIKDCYFVKGTFRASWAGPSANISKALCSNNSFTSAPINEAENSQSTVENMIIKEWNNEIRA